jgi:hypothetical protein
MLYSEFCRFSESYLLLVQQGFSCCINIISFRLLTCGAGKLSDQSLRSLTPADLYQLEDDRVVVGEALLSSVEVLGHRQLEDLGLQHEAWLHSAARVAIDQKVVEGVAASGHFHARQDYVPPEIGCPAGGLSGENVPVPAEDVRAHGLACVLSAFPREGANPGRLAAARMWLAYFLRRASIWMFR